MPITDIVSVRLDGEELDVTEIGISGSSLYFPEGMKGNSVIIELQPVLRKFLSMLLLRYF